MNAPSAPVARLARIAWAGLASSLLLASSAGAVPPAPQESGATSHWEDSVNGRPGPSKPDVFYPGFDTNTDAMPAPRRGGRVVVHIASLPKNINYMVENSAYTRRMLYEMHEFLAQRNWETWEVEPVLAESWDTEDTVILKGGRGEGNDNILYGKVTDAGDGYAVAPISPGNPLAGETRTVPKSEVESVQYATVFTFHLRHGVKWQDGHEFDANDVLFSYESYRNPSVDCDNVRFQFEKILDAEVLDRYTIRFFYENQYFLAADTFTGLMILPSHIYNLSDTDNPDYDPDASQSDQGSFINDHPNNTAWIGLGPYKMTVWSEKYVEAERFDDYFDQDDAGWVDTIRWRNIPDDDAAKTALINGELDYWDRLRSEDYFGEFTKQKEFTDHYYKALGAMPYMGYIAWNMRRPKFGDADVRRALGMCFDWDTYIATVANGLASRITGSQYYFSPMYDKSIEPIPFDLEAAEELLLEAGWYDRDGDGIIDKDGQPMTIEFLMPTGNKASTILGQTFQEQLAKVGVKMNISTRDWATFLERIEDGDFDCCNLAWVLTVESDPEQLWHSKWAPIEKRSSNHSGLADAKVDELIEAIQVELDDETRYDLFHRLQRRIYDLQPYVFGLNQPKKFVVSRKIRNFRSYAIDPNYRIRDWFLVDEGGGATASDGRAGN